MKLIKTTSYYTAKAIQEILEINEQQFYYYIKQAKHFSFFHSRPHFARKKLPHQHRHKTFYNLSTLIFIAHKVNHKEFLEFYYRDILDERLGFFGLKSYHIQPITSKSEYLHLLKHNSPQESLNYYRRLAQQYPLN